MKVFKGELDQKTVMSKSKILLGAVQHSCKKGKRYPPIIPNRIIILMTAWKQKLTRLGTMVPRETFI